MSSISSSPSSPPGGINQRDNFIVPFLLNSSSVVLVIVLVLVAGCCCFPRSRLCDCGCILDLDAAVVVGNNRLLVSSPSLSPSSPPSFVVNVNFDIDDDVIDIDSIENDDMSANNNAPNNKIIIGNDHNNLLVRIIEQEQLLFLYLQRSSSIGVVVCKSVVRSPCRWIVVVISLVDVSVGL